MKRRRLRSSNWMEQHPAQNLRVRNPPRSSSSSSSKNDKPSPSSSSPFSLTGKLKRKSDNQWRRSSSKQQRRNGSTPAASASIMAESRQNSQPNHNPEEASTSTSSTLIDENPTAGPAPSPANIYQNKYFPWKKIMSHLTWADLKTCRLVHPDWNQVISQELFGRDIFAVRFKYDRKSSHFIQDLEWRVDPRQSKNLQQLVTLLESPLAQNNFPVSHFEFLGGNLAQSDVQSLFNILGPQIKTLHIRRVPQGSRCGNKFHPLDFTSKSTLRHLLERQAPNVKKLEIGCFDTEWREGEKIEFTNVEILICGYEQNSEIPPKSTAFAMLKGAPKLKKVVNFKAEYTQWFIFNDKVNTIKEYHFEPNFAAENDDHLVRLAKARPMLKKLVILHHQNFSKLMDSQPENEDGEEVFVREKIQFWAKILHSILHSSRHSLMELIMTPLGLFCEDENEQILKMPRLPNVTELTLQSSKCENSILSQNQKKMVAPSFFPPRTDVYDVFPSLKILNVYCSTFLSQRIFEYFPKQQKYSTLGQLDLPTVTTLRFGAFATTQWCQYLTQWLPNVKTIALTAEVRKAWHQVERHVGNVCRHFEDIKRLQLLGCDRSLEVKHTVFDAALTGIPKDVCVTLSKTLIDYTPPVDEVKTNIGITHLKRLKKLDIHISNEKWEDRDPPVDFNLLSRVSRSYAFDLMPQTQVTIGFHQHCPSAEKITTALQSVAGPSVKFVHIHYEEYF